MDEKTKRLVRKAQYKDSLKQEFDFTLQQRVDRHFDVKSLEIFPNQYFTAVSAECYLLYRDGYYYGAISSIQAVAEALVKFLCQVSGWKPNDDFKKNIKQLKKRGKITDELAILFDKIWLCRNNYHHLNSQIEQDRKKLELLAKKKLTHLKNIEENLFAYSIKDGNLIPKYLKYWDQKQNTISALLRLD